MSTSREILQRKCVIHIQDIDGEIRLFTPEILKKCQVILEARKKLKLKHSQFILPDTCNNVSGYHPKCYRAFSAVKSTQLRLAASMPQTVENVTFDIESSIVPGPSKPRESRSTATVLKNPKTGILKNVCIFCNKLFLYSKNRKIPLSSCETKNFEKNIKEFAEYLNDSSLLRKISNIDFVAKEVKYHRLCRVKYEQNYSKKRSSEAVKPSIHKIHMEIHQQSFKLLCSYIEENVIQKNASMYLQTIRQMYVQYYFDLQYNYEENVPETTSHTISSIKQKLQNYFGNKIKFGLYKKRAFVYSEQICLNDALIQLSSESDINTASEVQNVAFQLRREILKMSKTPLPDNIELKDIYKGECKIPTLLNNFFTTLLSGTRCKRQKNIEEIKVNSLVQDAIYNVTNGRIKPTKHLELGLVIKSLTNSRKIIDILNRLGHCCSYTVLEEIETELTYAATASSTIVPDTLNRSAELFTALAFDNFDRFVETLHGKDTLHDTVGIIYQHFHCQDQEQVELLDDSETLPSTSSSGKGRKRRRAFDGGDQEIEPYYKKPKLLRTLRIPPSESIHFVDSYILLDKLWIFSLALLKQNIPMWVGWNNQKLNDDLPKQRIWYLPPINASPTSNAVVLHTLKIAKMVSKQCHQKYICVTYDLAIAKMALQIQSAEAPMYNDVFIMLGAFHIQMSFFKCLGKYIEESGGPHILAERNILAAGSLKGFITGTHFNRCKRVHGLLAAAVEILHIEQFLNTQTNDIVLDIMEELKIVQNLKANEIVISDTLKTFMANYEDYYRKTEEGKHGMTAKYWINYVNFMKLFNMFSRSIRCNDFDTYVACLPQVATLMFAFNHQNYSRWILRFYDNLIHLDETHPGLKENLINGGFSIRRTDKAFSRSPIDLTLEQTINADAANKMTGITSLTNSISARRRWALSHSLRTSLITHLLENLNLNKSEDISEELRPHLMKKNTNSLNEIITGFSANLNPFDSSIINENLYNVSTGKAASVETKNFLLNTSTIGEEAKKNFILACQEDAGRFEKPIKRINIKTFASEGKILVCKSKDKVRTIRLQRDLFGRLVVLGLENKIDLESIFSYPLTPVPLSLCHIDGSINKTSKSSLFHLLEKRIEPSEVTSTYDADSIIIDGFYFLHLIGHQLPHTFGNIAKHILKKICNLNGNRIDLIFDKFVHPSIKDVERDSRGNEDINFAIVGGDQKLSQDFVKSLRNNCFKIALVKFLIDNWASDEYADIINDKIIYVNCDDSCFKFSVNEKHVEKTLQEHLECQHEEADTRIVYHLINMNENSKVIIKASDTDVLVIILGNFHKLANNIQVWIECGLVSKNNLRFVDVNKIAQVLGSSICKALPAFHAFTGCDYSAAFSRKGKLNPFKILEKNKDIQTVFAGMGEREVLSDETSEGIEKFVCQMYGKPKAVHVNSARCEIFLDCYKPKPNSNPFDAIKTFEDSRLPPCRDVLNLKIKRTNQICAIWNFPQDKKPRFFDPTSHGWLLQNNHYDIQWFSGSLYPDKLEQVLANEEQNEESDDEEVQFSSSSDEDDE